MWSRKFQIWGRRMAEVGKEEETNSGRFIAQPQMLRNMGTACILEVPAPTPIDAIVQVRLPFPFEYLFQGPVCFQLSTILLSSVFLVLFPHPAFRKL